MWRALMVFHRESPKESYQRLFLLNNSRYSPSVVVSTATSPPRLSSGLPSLCLCRLPRHATHPWIVDPWRIDRTCPSILVGRFYALAIHVHDPNPLPWMSSPHRSIWPYNEGIPLPFRLRSSHMNFWDGGLHTFHVNSLRKTVP